MRAYLLKARTPVASTYVMKVGELGPGAVSIRWARGYIPASALYGALTAKAVAERLQPPAEPACREEKAPWDVGDLEKALAEIREIRPVSRVYPALWAVEKDGRALGVFECEKGECIYVDYCNLTAFRGPPPPQRPRAHRTVGIYRDRADKTARHGLIYSYEVVEWGLWTAAFRSAADPAALRLGYKKTYGYGEVEVEPHCDVVPARSTQIMLLSPVPIDVIENIRNIKSLKVKSLKIRFIRHFVYLSYTNSFYVVAPTFNERFAAPGTVIEFDAPTSPLEIWQYVEEASKNWRVYKLAGERFKEANKEEAELARAKAAATYASPVALWR